MPSAEASVTSRAESTVPTDAMTTVPTDAMETHSGALRDRRWRRLAVVAVVSFVMLGLLNVWGPRQSVTRRDGASHQITLTAPSISRGGLAATWQLSARRLDDQTLGRELEVVLEKSYLDIFDQNALDPTPAESWTDGQSVHWRFELPSGVDEFSVTLDARIQPDARWRHSGSVTVHFEDESLAVDHTTWLVP